MKHLVKMLKYSLLAAVGYLIICAVFVGVILSGVAGENASRIVNFGTKPKLLVWYDSNEEFLQGLDIEINAEPLIKGDFFNTSPALSAADADYWLFLIDENSALPPASVLETFNISDDKIQSVLNGNITSDWDAPLGLRFSLFPIDMRYRSVTLVNYSDFAARFDPKCHRDLLFKFMIAIKESSDLVKSCRLE